MRTWPLKSILQTPFGPVIGRARMALLPRRFAQGGATSKTIAREHLGGWRPGNDAAAAHEPIFGATGRAAGSLRGGGRRRICANVGPAPLVLKPEQACRLRGRQSCGAVLRLSLTHGFAGITLRSNA